MTENELTMAEKNAAGKLTSFCFKDDAVLALVAAHVRLKTEMYPDGTTSDIYCLKLTLTLYPALRPGQDHIPNSLKIQTI